MSIDDWTEIKLIPSVTTNINAIAYGNGKFMLVGAATIITLDSSGTWTSASGTFPSLLGVAYGNNRFVAVGNKTGVWPDGGPWSSQALTGGISWLRAIAFGNGQFVAVGDSGAIQTSGDGVTWALQSAPVPSSVNFEAITFGNGKFVAGASNATIFTSGDGITWTMATSPPTLLRGAAFGSSGFVGVTSGTGAPGSPPLLTSTDGSSWTSQGGPAGGLRGIGYGGQTFVVVGDTGRIFRSSDQGASWSNSNTTVTGLPTLNAVAYGNNGFVAVGVGGTILQSEFASLSALTCSAGPLTPAFDPGKTSYDVTAAGGSATVTPTVTDSTATIAVRFSSIGRPPTGSYSPVLSGTASAAAIVAWRLTTFEIKVTASNGATKTYTVGVHREFPVLLRWLSWFWIR